CGAQVTDVNLLPGSILNITVQSPDYDNSAGTSAIGHFTMHADNGVYCRFLYDPIWVNGCTCENCENIPLAYTSQWYFYRPTPPKGTYFDVWITIYWNCDTEGGAVVADCNSEIVHHRDFVK
ncbi:10551_t:CDS:1, partial [Acaulospora morrowiae]